MPKKMVPWPKRWKSRQKPWGRACEGHDLRITAEQTHTCLKAGEGRGRMQKEEVATRCGGFVEVVALKEVQILAMSQGRSRCFLKLNHSETLARLSSPTPRFSHRTPWSHCRHG